MKPTLTTYYYRYSNLGNNYYNKLNNVRAHSLKQTRSQIDDEHYEDDLDSEDKRLVDELMVFNVDNDTSDVSDADK